MRRLFLILFILTFALSSGNSQIFHKNASRKVEKNLFGSSLSRKKPVKIKEPRSITRAKKQQEAKKRKLDKDYAKSVKKSQKRAFDIQTPEVQERMKQDKKTIAAREKERKKKTRAGTKNAAKKYK
jgi:hypothetical protein